MLRRKSPDPTSATSASAISETTSKPRKRLWVQPSAPPAAFQNFVDVRAGSFDGRDNAKDQAGQQRDNQGESQHADIKGKINRSVEKKRRPEGPQHIATPV